MAVVIYCARKTIRAITARGSPEKCNLATAAATLFLTPLAFPGPQLPPAHQTDIQYAELSYPLHRETATEQPQPSTQEQTGCFSR
eukprot:6831953-Pyramimonas_sp.AAC.1